jgi:hypothetical protein
LSKDDVKSHKETTNFHLRMSEIIQVSISPTLYQQFLSTKALLAIYYVLCGEGSSIHEIGRKAAHKMFAKLIAGKFNGIRVDCNDFADTH